MVYDDEFKRRAVQMYGEVQSLSKVCKALGCSRAALSRWAREPLLAGVELLARRAEMLKALGLSVPPRGIESKGRVIDVEADPA